MAGLTQRLKPIGSEAIGPDRQQTYERG